MSNIPNKQYAMSSNRVVSLPAAHDIFWAIEMDFTRHSPKYVKEWRMSECSRR